MRESNKASAGERRVSLLCVCVYARVCGANAHGSDSRRDTLDPISTGTRESHDLARGEGVHQYSPGSKKLAPRSTHPSVSRQFNRPIRLSLSAPCRSNCGHQLGTRYLVHGRWLGAISRGGKRKASTGGELLNGSAIPRRRVSRIFARRMMICR